MLEQLRLKLRRGELGTLPFVMQSLLTALSDPNASAKKLGRVIMADQALAASVLRVANSAYYGLSQQVSDIGQAVTLIGFGALRELVMSITSYDLIFRHGAVTFDRQALWNHSISVACCSRVMARRYRNIPAEVVFVAGILHEIGYTLMDQHAHSLFVTIVSTARQLKQSIHQVERTLVGVTHAEVGQWAAEAWNLPPVLQNAIRYHHEPFQAPPEHQPSAAIVSMADLLCKDLYVAEKDRIEQTRILSDYMKLKDSDLEGIRQETLFEVTNVSQFLGIQERDNSQGSDTSGTAYHPSTR